MNRNTEKTVDQATVKQKKSKKTLLWKIPLIAVASLLVIVTVCVSYVFISYSRIDDNTVLEVTGKAAHDAVKIGDEYTAVTYNIGFGAYTPDFTFFMDGGTQSWANSKEIFNKTVEEQYTWAAPFPDDLMPAHFRKVTDYALGATVPTCRNCDKPAGPDCFTVTIDGFIVSDNIETTYVDVIDNGFKYSDHNPVEMRFKLK